MSIAAHRRRGLRPRRAHTVATTLALALAHGAGAATAETPLVGARFVCAHYDPERAAWTGTVAVLEPEGDVAAARAERPAAYRLLVLAMLEGAPHTAPQASALTTDEALALLANAQAALRDGRAVREQYRGRVVRDRERHRLRFSGADARAMPTTMIVFTVPGLAIIESGTARARQSDGRSGAHSRRSRPMRCSPRTAPRREPGLSTSTPSLRRRQRLH